MALMDSEDIKIAIPITCWIVQTLGKSINERNRVIALRAVLVILIASAPNSLVIAPATDDPRNPGWSEKVKRCELFLSLLAGHPRHATPRHARRTLTYDALAGVHTSLTCCDEQYKEGNLLEGRSLPNHIYILPSNFQYSPWFQFWICPLH